MVISHTWLLRPDDNVQGPAILASLFDRCPAPRFLMGASSQYLGQTHTPTIDPLFSASCYGSVSKNRFTC